MEKRTRELTNKEKREYSRMVRGSRQMSLYDFMPESENGKKKEMPEKLNNTHM